MTEESRRMIERYKEAMARCERFNGYHAATEYATLMRGSMSLGRPFGETKEEYQQWIIDSGLQEWDKWYHNMLRERNWHISKAKGI